jgi:hypothetical protein
MGYRFPELFRTRYVGTVAFARVIKPGKGDGRIMQIE